MSTKFECPEMRHLEDWIETDVLVTVLERVVVNLHLHLVPGHGLHPVVFFHCVCTVLCSMCSG